MPELSNRKYRRLQRASNRLTREANRIFFAWVNKRQIIEPSNLGVERILCIMHEEALYEIDNRLLGYAVG